MNQKNYFCNELYRLAAFFFPMVENLLQILNDKSPSQFKKIHLNFNELGEDYQKELKGFLDKFIPFWESLGMEFHEVVDAFLNLCNQYMYYQVRFQKNRKYPFYENPEATLKKINELYKDKKEMKRYMAGLSLSLVLWKNHYLISGFFGDCLKRHNAEINNYLEVGVGHGFYFSEALSFLNSGARKTAVDLSPVSIELTKKTVNFFHPNVLFEAIEMDFLQFSGQKGVWDFITMGEVLEHVQTPGLFFQKAHDLLSDEGKLFFSTCVNCPILDHLYHFRNVEEIRSLVNDAGFSIESEQIIPAENLPMEEIVRDQITINYAALINKKEVL